MKGNLEINHKKLDTENGKKIDKNKKVEPEVDKTVNKTVNEKVNEKVNKKVN